MKKLFTSILFCISTASSGASDVCINHFPNFLSDICWSCMFPMKLASVPIGGTDQMDWDSGINSPICGCSNSAKVGIPISFWEPAIIIDSHTVPGCLTTLAGLQLPIGGQMSAATESGAGRGKMAFRQSTYYTSPVMYLLQAVMDDTCADRSPFDVAWTSEIDPTWNDDQLSAIKMPIAFAFGSMAANMAGTVDAIAATAGWPIDQIFWQAGTWGGMYPLNGNSQYSSDNQLGLLTITKMLAIAHNMKEMSKLFGKGGGKSYGPDAMCLQTPAQWPVIPIMAKRQYKVARIYPLPQTAKIGGLCCLPIGRSTLLSEVGTQGPTPNFKDYGFIVFRKRDCCAGVVGPSTF